MSDRNSPYRRATRVVPTQVGERPVESREAFEALRSQENFRRQIADQQLIGKPISYSVVHSRISSNEFFNPAGVNLQQLLWFMDVLAGTLLVLDRVAYSFTDPALDFADELSIKMELGPLGVIGLGESEHISPNWFHFDDNAISGRRIRPSFGTTVDPAPVEPIVIPGPRRLLVILERAAVTFNNFYTLILVVHGRLVVPVGGR
jgi:hypothetical protein